MERFSFAVVNFKLFPVCHGFPRLENSSFQLSRAISFTKEKLHGTIWRIINIKRPNLFPHVV